MPTPYLSLAGVAASTDRDSRLLIGSFVPAWHFCFVGYLWVLTVGIAVFHCRCSQFITFLMFSFHACSLLGKCHFMYLLFALHVWFLCRGLPITNSFLFVRHGGISQEWLVALHLLFSLSGSYIGLRHQILNNMPSGFLSLVGVSVPRCDLFLLQ